MKRLLPSCATAIAVLLVPAAAAAQSQTGAVLRVDRAHHRVEIVDAQHAVHSYSAPRRAARKLRPGAKLSFQATGRRISSLRVSGRTHKLSFYGKVVNAGSRGAVFRLGDGKQLRLAKRQRPRRAHHRRSRGTSVRINVQGLQPGQLVLITESVDSAGNLTITIKLVPAPDPTADDQDVTGTITAIGPGSVTIQADGGSSMTFQASSDVLDGFEVGDAVDVTYYTEADGTLVADDIEPLDDGGDSGDELDAIGVITAVGTDTVSIQVDGGGPLTFEAGPDLSDGFSVGDHVDVTYWQDDDGSLVADDIESADDPGDGSGE
jgi:Domain of unknown function (DUF5666)